MARPRPLFSVLQPQRLIPGRDSPRSTEAPHPGPPPQVRPQSLQEPPLGSRGGRALGGAPLLSRDPASRAPGRALQAGANPIYAHALPRAHLLSSHGVVVPMSPSPRVPEPERASTHRVFGVPRRLSRTERPQLSELWRLGVPRAAPAAESEVASSPRPRRQRQELVPAASARAARARLVR